MNTPADHMRNALARWVGLFLLISAAIMLAIWGYNQLHQRRVPAGMQPVRQRER